MDNVIECGGFTFLSNFDSGNLARVELVPKQAATTTNSTSNVKSSPIEDPVDFEFNIWTRPDCLGTEYENCNRTWFYFGIKGGAPFAVIKLNIVNLNKQSKMYSQGMAPVFRIVPGRSQWDRIKDKPTYTVEENNFTLSFKYRTLENLRATTYFAFTYPFSYADLQEMLTNIDARFTGSSSTPQADDVYYHRECVCYSSAGLRVDLITISSHHGISKDRETRLKHLFPENDVPRPFNFSGKKVIFLSARVHPGETPSSFVLNGFLNLLLNRDDQQAISLRKTYVFKLIPMLNPDGVSKGHYRTDMRGVNLNRVYLNPSLAFHPPVFAARSLLRFYHHGWELDDDISSDADISNLDIETDECLVIPDGDDISPTDAVLDASALDAVVNKVTNIESQVSGLTLDEKDDSQMACFESDKTVFLDVQESLLKTVTMDGEVANEQRTYTINVVDEGSRSTNFILETEAQLESRLEPMPDANTESALQSVENDPNKGSINLNTCETVLKKSAVGYGNAKSKSIDSGLFLYIDMHGHASKKGIFMYGNHFENIGDSIECMLLPKIMALNSQNFHFTACNFTERNMYLRDRRDGMSREGSGRVAVLKATGLVRSYTLECNYNTGRLVNILPPCARDNGKPSLPLLVPPKYTPAVFEEIGRALGVSILDLTGSNPWSRIPNSEFHTVSGIRDWLRQNCVPEQIYLRKQQRTQLAGSSQVASSSGSSIPRARLHGTRTRRVTPISLDTKPAEVISPLPNSERKENLGGCQLAPGPLASSSARLTKSCSEPKENVVISCRNRNSTKKLKNMSSPSSGVLKQVLAVRTKSTVVGALAGGVKSKSSVKAVQRISSGGNVGSQKSVVHRSTKFRKTTNVVSLALCAFPESIKANQLLAERKIIRLSGQRSSISDQILPKGPKRMKITPRKLDQASCSYLLKSDDDFSEGIKMEKEMINCTLENSDVDLLANPPGCSLAILWDSNQEPKVSSSSSSPRSGSMLKCKTSQGKVVVQSSSGKPNSPLIRSRIIEGLNVSATTKCGMKLDKQSKARGLHVNPVKGLHKSPSFSKRKTSELVKKRGKVTLKSLATSVGKLRIPNNSEQLQTGLVEKKRKKPAVPKFM